ncbi:MAG: hypothetical protein K0S65_3004 [Labilithrix sp.]|nr:hypothetical protein [Labilithrix sp.]
MGLQFELGRSEVVGLSSMALQIRQRKEKNTRPRPFSASARTGHGSWCDAHRERESKSGPPARARRVLPRSRTRLALLGSASDGVATDCAFAPEGERVAFAFAGGVIVYSGLDDEDKSTMATFSLRAE